MNDFIATLFEPFAMSHGHCYQWDSSLIALHAISDGVIAASYFAIPLLLIYFVRKRRDVAFKWMFGLFGAFIFACGITHAMEIWSIWNGTYWLTGLVKAFTAVVSASTAVLLISLVPKALSLPGPNQLEEANRALRDEVTRREEAEEAMRMLNAELEKRVAERTAEMGATNERLRYEVDERRAAEARAARLAAVVEASEDAVTRQTVNGIITDWNPGAERLYGYTAAEAIGEHIRLVIPQRFHAHIEDLASQIDRGERIRSIEVKRQTKDGQELTISLSAVPIRDADGRVEAVATIERDVTERNEAERALRDAEEMRRLALDAAKLGAWELDTVGECILLDERCAQLYGFPPDVGSASYEVAGARFHPDDAEGINAATVAALDPSGDGSFKHDYRVVHPDGTIVWIAGRGQAYFPDDVVGKPPTPESIAATRFIGTMRDITEERAAHLEIERTARLLRLSYDAIIVRHLDGDEGITFWNAGAEELYGYSAEEVQGQQTHRLLYSSHEMPWERIHEILRTRGVWEGQVRHTTKDGREVVVASRQQLIADDDGTVVIAINRDVTERDRAERMIEASLERYETLVEATAGVVWSTPPSGQLIGPQPSWQAFTGQTEEEYGHWGWLDMIHPEDRARTAAIWSEALDAQTLYQVEHRLLRSDGVYRDMLVRAVPRISDGQVTEWVGLHTDVTHLKEAESALEEAKNAAEAANNAKSRFLASMSHELRTPLNAVIGYSELLQEEAQDLGYESFLPELEKIRSAGKQLLSLVNDVLDLSKIEAGRVELSLKTLEVKPIVDSVIAVAEPLAQRNSNTLSAYVAPDVTTAHSDETKLRQVLFNLIGNATKFTHEGEVDVRVELLQGDYTRDPNAPEEEDQSARPEVAETLAFSVQDTGIGMTPEQMENLFVSFYRTEEDSANYEGTGLGLAITRRLTHLMGGRVAVKSERGVGTTFTVFLPRTVATNAADLANADARARSGIVDEKDTKVVSKALAAGAGTAPEPTVPEPAFQRDATKQLVLVIDDDPNARDLLRTYLQREGFDVVVAASGVQGLRLAHELRPAAITTDLAMPHLDGWDVLSALKSDPLLADTPVIVVTIEDDDRRVFALGAAEYLTKPVDRDRLVRVTRRLIATPEDAHVLIVEDDDATREIVQRTLANNGFITSEARNGQEAVLSLVEETPDAILLDLMMPKMDGFEFVDELRKHETWRQIPVIVMTAKDINPEERRRLNGFVETILTKGSYSRNELLREVCERVAAAALDADHAERADAAQEGSDSE